MCVEMCDICMTVHRLVGLQSIINQPPRHCLGEAFQIVPSTTQQ